MCRTKASLRQLIEWSKALVIQQQSARKTDVYSERTDRRSKEPDESKRQVTDCKILDMDRDFPSVRFSI